MRKIFAVLAVLVLLTGVSRVFANHISMPNLPIGETAYKIQKFQESCGEIVVYAYKQNGFWAVYTLNGKWLAVISYENEPFAQKAWFIHNLDGHIDEYLDNAMIILTKYPSLCDAVR